MKPVKPPQAGRTRRTARAALACVFVAGLSAAGAFAAMNATPRHFRHHFDHNYPPDPVQLERPKVSGPAPTAPRANTVDVASRLNSLAELARAVPGGVLRRLGADTWRLTQPVTLARGATLDVTGGRLELAPGSFLQAVRDGRLVLKGMTIVGVNARGAPLTTPSPRRAFLDARDGGSLLLESDTLSNLGHLGVVSYGISFRRPGSGCAVLDSTITGNYFGVFMSHASGVQIAGNEIDRSEVYGIDPFGRSSDIMIERNRVVDSGIHAIVLADHVARINVRDNVVVTARAHGIVLFNGASASTIVGNRIEGTFDGLVVTASSGNVLRDNTIVSPKRFGVRLNEGAAHNRVVGNSVSDALLGLYVYGGATGNALLRNSFANNRENVRVRSDAPQNRVDPVPPLSEVSP